MDLRVDALSSLCGNAVIKKQGPREWFANFFTVYGHHDCPRKHWFAFLSSQHTVIQRQQPALLYSPGRATSLYMGDLVYLDLRIPRNTLSCVNRWRERHFSVFLCQRPQGDLHFPNGPTAQSLFAIKSLGPEL